MIIPIFTREDLIKFLPKNYRVAEIGVLDGDFSDRILKICSPSELYLIDLWGPSENMDYRFDPGFQSIEEGEIKYQEVLKRFSNEINSGQVKVIKSSSSNCVNNFPDNYFDWIYFDADHTYEYLLQDLRSYSKKIKPEGFILGHDCTNNYSAQKMKFGVIEAVNDFVVENKYHLLAATLAEDFPSYIISKIYSVEADTFLYNIIRDCRISFDIDKFLDFNFIHYMFWNDGERTVIKLKEKPL